MAGYQIEKDMVATAASDIASEQPSLDIDIEKSPSSLVYGTFKPKHELQHIETTQSTRHDQRVWSNILRSLLFSLALVGSFAMFAFLVLSL